MLITDIHYMLTFASSAVILTLGLLLKAILLPDTAPWHKLRIARKYLSLSYLILAGFGLFSVFVGDEANDPMLLTVSTLFIGAFQALLFTATILVFIQPNFVQKRWVWGQFIAVCSGGTMLFSALFCLSRQSFHILLYVISALYLLQQIYYIRLFRKQYRACIRQLEDYYDEDEDLRLRWVKFSFYSALSIGLMALVAPFCGLWPYDGFVILYTVYYSYMVARFYNYQIQAGFIIPAVTVKKTPEAIEEECADVDTDPAGFPKKDQLFRERLEEWVTAKCYLQNDLGVDEIAGQLGVNRNYLRYYFRTYVHEDFRTWRSELRILEAKDLLIKYPDMSLEKVGEKVGFNHRANFFQQFQKVTGMTPTVYRIRSIQRGLSDGKNTSCVPQGKKFT